MTGREYELAHRTEYRYDDDVRSGYGRAYLTPRNDNGQTRLAHLLAIEPAPSEQHEHTDFFGNRSTYFSISSAHRRLSVTAHSRVAVHRRRVDPDELDMPWARARDALANRHDISPDLVAARPFTLPSPLIGLEPAVARFAGTLIAPGASLGAAVIALTEGIHDGFAYVSGSTTVGTTLTEVLTTRKGVCQDFAHLAVACLRSVGLAARYVSGYIQTNPPPGARRLIGADATHAWASVFAPEVGWVDLDPTNRAFVDNRYVIAAIGRDYADVPPLRGVIFTESPTSTMTVAVDVVPVEAPPGEVTSSGAVPAEPGAGGVGAA